MDKKSKLFLIYDTETTGLPDDFNASISNSDNWPRCVQIAWQLHDEKYNLIENKNYIIKCENFEIPYQAEKIHGISTKLSKKIGVTIDIVLKEFYKVVEKSDYIIGHNINFDIKIIGAEFYRLKVDNILENKAIIDTCVTSTANLLKIKSWKKNQYKLPTLIELYKYLFNDTIYNAHNASVDVQATARCFFELLKRKILNNQLLNNDQTLPDILKDIIIKDYNIDHVDLKKLSKELEDLSDEKNKNIKLNKKTYNFTHLHVHSQFSILQSTISIDRLIEKTIEYGMNNVAITDIGNMMGAFIFKKKIKEFNKKNKTKLKGIIGVELFICDNHLEKNKNNVNKIIALAKTKIGYENLIKLVSISNIKGFYYVPRIDKKLLQDYKKDIIILSGSIEGLIPNKILKYGEKKAEEELQWWKDTFGKDFYIQISNHNRDEEIFVNKILINLSKKHNIKIIASNNVYYLDQNDYNAHDILLCIKDGQKKNTKIGIGRNFRYGLINNEYYFKSPEEMIRLFKNIPDSLNNIEELVNKIEDFDLNREILLPKFDIPIKHNYRKKEEEYEFLKKITYEGLYAKYNNINNDLLKRIEFELQTIKKTGYPGYFLIVYDLIKTARKMGVYVGPGRGSVAGSLVAYSLNITNIDPIKYNLLFERFLNPDRISMPDIDIDFDDEGRNLVIDYVVKKYGYNQVAQIITYGKMAAKMAIRDSGRVLDLPLIQCDKLAKLISNISLKDVINYKEEHIEDNITLDNLEKVKKLRAIYKSKTLEAKVLKQAKIIEGSIRNTGIHACGIIISPEDITNIVPVSINKDNNLLITQYDNSVCEEAGLLKMDFLGLKTLSLIKYTLEIIKNLHNKIIDINNIPLNDIKTYELFKKGETIGIFQYESQGMQKYMRELKPNVFEDLIAMNALYRPGPIEYIPSFIRRKHGLEKISYDFEVCKNVLKETYGITVYQEQVMILSQKLASFSEGDADILRKAMGKKQKNILDVIKPKFINQAISNGFDKDKLLKIWKDWESFASYAFNKSHSTCYAMIGYQTAYLKSNYPAEYMASVLSYNMNDLNQIRLFINECNKMNIEVLCPDINESTIKFNVNKNNQIRFGIGAIKGVGTFAVNNIIEERKKNGFYKDIFDFVKRINLKIINKKVIESLILAGVFDSFNQYHRGFYFYKHSDKELSNIEKIIKYAHDYQQRTLSNQMSIFDIPNLPELNDLPILNDCEKWNDIKILNMEKEVIGIYLSSHPLNYFKHEISLIPHIDIKDIKINKDSFYNKNICIIGIINNVIEKVSKNNNKYAIFNISDYTDTYEIIIFGEEYLKFKHLIENNNFVLIEMNIIKKIFNEYEKVYTKIHKIDLLNNKLKQVKSITFDINTNTINKVDIENLKNQLIKYKGKVEVKFHIFCKLRNIQDVFLSKSIKVNINKNLLLALDSLKINYKIDI